MVVKKPVVKKKRRAKKKKPLTQSQTQKQVVNVYLNKLNRQRRAKKTAPQMKQVIQRPQMYNAGIDNLNDIVLGLTRRNNTLMGILDKQRKTDTTPNSDITSLDDVVENKRVKIDDINVMGLEETDDYEDLNKPKNIVMDTSSRQNISDRLTSIAEGMDEIPQGGRIKNTIMELGDRIRPTPEDEILATQGVRVRAGEYDRLNELARIEVEYGNLINELQLKSLTDKKIKMSKYINKTRAGTLPVKVSTLKKLVSVMKEDLNQSLKRRQPDKPVVEQLIRDDDDQTFM
tara:strand:+ start:643 stop:1506 length:864 start_codon:yes stop_codon:yes gene_type:complete